jgi:hypothetical protein
MVISHCRGHRIIYNWKTKAWTYLDGSNLLAERPCIRCGKKPTDEGYDNCIGNIEGAYSACCGHGVEDPYIYIVTQIGRKGKTKCK